MDKWYALAVIAFVLAMFGGAVYADYTKGQCRIQLADKQYSAEDIVKACN